LSGKVSKETLIKALKNPNMGPGIPSEMAMGLTERVNLILVRPAPEMNLTVSFSAVLGRVTSEKG
jgi:hypothetical protein